jgi:hypothetical protein
MSAFDDIMVDLGTPVVLEQTGESITYHQPGEQDVVLTGSFRPQPSDLADMEPGTIVDVRTGLLEIAKTALASPARDDSATIRSALWTVVTVDDCGAFWRLHIKRGVLVERAAEPVRIPRL